MGHEVLTPHAVVGYSRSGAINFLRDFAQRTFPERWTPIERWAVTAARQCRGADLLIWLTQSLREDVLYEVRRLGVRHCVAWWGDPPANMRGLGLLVQGWDRIFFKDAAAVAKFQAVGLPAQLLHEACNPAWHRRNFTRVGEEIAVAGNYYGYRQYLVGRLLETDEPMALYGPPAPRWADPRIKAAHRGRFIVKDEKSRIFGEALACLNSTSLSEGNSLNCRAFEIAGACGLQLIENKTAVETCFEPGNEVLTYSCLEEIRDHLARARREPDWAMGVRQAGHRRAHAEHTYEKRLTQILRSIELAAA